eukprot:TRINITY_DN48891_c0_g1_i1.p1 TRINITY_DN48891_c0_g1~~TRINITY_DN48891_c0_g1_i1.p1  ORF type:complete len:558 (+),score=52.72 TRINITY_DN48891_c0_g1_i1:52-1725(+)
MHRAACWGVAALCLYIDATIGTSLVDRGDPSCAFNAQGEEECAEGEKRSSVRAVIVDEHHHVVDHWFSLPGVQEGSHYNATLLHIDAHSDFGPPLNEDFIAPFPNDLNDLRERLENDQFIAMAMRHGIIGRLINVYPSWSYWYVHPDDKKTKFMTVGMHTSGEMWCECTAYCRQKTAKKCKRKCEANEEPVPSRECNIAYEIEVVSYGINRAIEEGFGIDTTQPLLLDFDEDYFAVESPFVKSMLTGHKASSEASIELKERDGLASSKWLKGDILVKMQKRLHGKFCARPPRVAQRERAVDVYMRAVGALVLAIKESKRELARDDVSVAIRRLSQVNATLLNEVSDALCSRQIVAGGAKDGGDVQVLPESTADELLLTPSLDTVVEIATEYAWSLYKHVPAQGIYKLLSYGFCIHCDEVPRAGYYLWTCMGSSGQNDQTSDRLELHDGSAREIEEEMARLHSFLLSLLEDQPAAMITVCRSSRDGYIPKELWRSVEDGVLGIVDALASKWKQTVEKIYDRDCFWGESGHPSRAVLPIVEFLQEDGLKTDGYYTRQVL